MKPSYDVCVFGAGPAGVAVAARLTDLGLAAIVLDRPLKKKPWGGESFTGAIQQPLSTLGLWEDFRAAGHVAGYEQRTAWGGEPWAQSSIFKHDGNSWHVDRGRFDDDLRQGIRGRGVPIVTYRTLETLRREDERWLVVLDEGFEITSKFVVDATGRASAIARRLGVRPRFYDRLIALTALVPRNRNPEFDHSMVIETTPDGWWYAAPVPQGHVLAFFTDADLAPAALKRSMRTVAASSAFTQTGRGHGWLAVGDACAAHDPLCGWGVYRAMTNGILAADAIRGNLEMGDSALLEEYHRHCRSQFETYLEGLTRHYSYEQRWPTSTFWERRAGSLSLST